MNVGSDVRKLRIALSINSLHVDVPGGPGLFNSVKVNLPAQLNKKPVVLASRAGVTNSQSGYSMGRKLVGILFTLIIILFVL